jgi:hypothetical protein
MLVTGISLNQFRAIVNEVSASYDGNVDLDRNTREYSYNRFRARIKTIKSVAPGSRRSASGRRGPYACWHVSRDVLIKVFETNEGARVQTALTTYRGADDFYDQYPETAFKNIGSMVYPAYMPELCDC